MRFIYIFFAPLLCFSRTVFRVFLSIFFSCFFPPLPVLALRLSCVSSSFFIAMFFSIYFVYFFVCYFMLIWFFSIRFFCIFFFFYFLRILIWAFSTPLSTSLHLRSRISLLFCFHGTFSSLRAPFFHKIIVCLCASTSSTDHYRATIDHFISFHSGPVRMKCLPNLRRGDLWPV